jgi:hypothetical protein
MDLDYKELFKSESGSNLAAFGLKIMVAVHPRREEGETETPKVDLNHETIRYAMYDAEKALREAVLRVMIAQMPSQQKRGADSRAAMLSCFADQPIYVEDIPNQYCKDYCCSMLQWHNVTTSVGVITIGPRKRVINIDWTKTRGTKTAEELFPNESGTKGERYIHAWSIEQARDYVQAIVSGVPLLTEQNATVST